MKEIHVDGQIVQVDNEDYEYIVNCYDIKINSHGYPYCSPKKKFKHKRMGLFSMTLHKILMNPEETGRKINVDHIDGNKLNNQKSNLRLCSHMENMRNRNGETDGTSQYKGITWNKKLQKWKVRINVNDESIYLGIFKNEICAANCYNHYAKLYHGEFAQLNNAPYVPKEEWEKDGAIEKTSKYRGVSLNRETGLYKAQIWDGTIKKNVQLGEYKSEIEAAKIYNEKAIELKGSKAKLNKV
jgi:hypothetical protein